MKIFPRFYQNIEKEILAASMFTGVTFYRVCHGFRLTKRYRDDYFWIEFDNF